MFHFLRQSIAISPTKVPIPKPAAELKMPSLVTIKHRANVGIIRLERDKFDEKMGNEFGKILESVPNAVDQINVLALISSNDGIFSMGTSAEQLLKCINDPEIQAANYTLNAQNLLKRWKFAEGTNKPTLAIVNGPCFDGGFELFLNTKHRIGINSKKTCFALPEAHFGLLPAATGTQRLVQLIGPWNAIPILLGFPVNAKKALRLGIIEKLIEADAFDNMEDLAIKEAEKILTNNGGVAFSWKQWMRQIALKFIWPHFIFVPINFYRMGTPLYFWTKGKPYSAHLKQIHKYIFEAVKMGIEKGEEHGLAVERKAFVELARSNEARVLIEQFYERIKAKEIKKC